MRHVDEYCSRKVVTVPPDESLFSVAQRMREHHVGCVVVVQQDDQARLRPMGLVTDRDIVVRVLAQTDQHLEQIRVDDIMSKPVVLAREGDVLADGLSVMRAAGVRRLVIVDGDDALVGLLSFDDLLDYLQDTAGELSALLSREQRQERWALR